MAEDEGRAVGDLGLHRDDGWQPLPHQRLADPGEGIAARGACAFTGVEHGELQVARVVQQRAEARTGHAVRGAVLALEDEHAPASSRSKPPWPMKWKTW